MLERVLENWLDNASERSLQVPFAHMLQAEGYTVVHISRHCGMEMGKDLIAIDPNGIPCAMQLKGAGGKRITLARWRNEIAPEVNDLLTGKIVHPSISDPESHRSILVTNGELAEEVARAIDDLNRFWSDRGHPEIRLETMLRGELLDRAKQAGSSLWPSELRDVRAYLEFFLLDGRRRLPKEKLASLLASVLPLHQPPVVTGNSGEPSRAELMRRISSCALLCSFATSPFSTYENHVAELEAWTIFLAYVFATAECWSLDPGSIKRHVDIVKDTICSRLESLCEELMTRKHYVEGDPLADQPVYLMRMTLLLALMSIYGLWRRQRQDEPGGQDAFIETFLRRRKHQLFLWGEAAVPQFLAIFWYWRNIDASLGPEYLLQRLVDAIAAQNDPRGRESLANPYFDENAVMARLLGFPDDHPNESSRGLSYTIDGLVSLLVRRGWKQYMKINWPAISRLSAYSFIPEELWQYYLWRSSRGTNIVASPPLTKAWADLQNEAEDDSGSSIPQLLRQDPVLFLLFLVVFPHRVRADAIRWLDSALRGLRR